MVPVCVSVVVIVIVGKRRYPNTLEDDTAAAAATTTTTVGLAAYQLSPAKDTRMTNDSKGRGGGNASSQIRRTKENDGRG
jgi:hypothetical protein